MKPKLLLTSFTTWKPEQSSNSADDLLEILAYQSFAKVDLHLLRQLPVDYDQAPAKIIQQIQQIQPQGVICCGMAEVRSRLNVERQGTHRQDRAIRQQTLVNLEELTQGLIATDISDDAGNFVCNHTYYAVLHHLSQTHASVPCLFLHVPVLTTANTSVLVTDAMQIIERLLTVSRAATEPQLGASLPAHPAAAVRPES
jgi:pyroglutamyl-peptidase